MACVNEDTKNEETRTRHLARSICRRFGQWHSMSSTEINILILIYLLKNKMGYAASAPRRKIHFVQID